MAGKPLLMAVDGDAAHLVLQSGSGVVAESQNPEALSYAAEKLAATSKENLVSMGDKGKHFYYENLSLAEGVRRFGEIFNHISDESK